MPFGRNFKMRIFSVLLFAFCFCLTKVHNAECVIIDINRICNESYTQAGVSVSDIGIEVISAGKEIVYVYQTSSLSAEKKPLKICVLNENNALIGIFYIGIKNRRNLMYIEFGWFLSSRDNELPLYNIQGYICDDTDIFYCNLILSGEGCRESYINVFHGAIVSTK